MKLGLFVMWITVSLIESPLVRWLFQRADILAAEDQLE